MLKFRCIYCDHTFSTTEELKNHKKTLHKKINRNMLLNKTPPINSRIYERVKPIKREKQMHSRIMSRRDWPRKGWRKHDKR